MARSKTTAGSARVHMPHEVLHPSQLVVRLLRHRELQFVPLRRQRRDDCRLHRHGPGRRRLRRVGRVLGVDRMRRVDPCRLN